MPLGTASYAPPLNQGGKNPSGAQPKNRVPNVPNTGQASTGAGMPGFGPVGSQGSGQLGYSSAPPLNQRQPFLTAVENGYNELSSNPQYILGQQALLDSIHRRQGTIDLTGAHTQDQVGFLNRGYENSLGHVNIAESNNQIDLGAARRQPGLIEQQQGLNDQSYNQNDAYMAQLMGLSTQDYQRAKGYLAQQQGFVGQQYGQDVSKANLTSDSAKRVMYDDAAARGATASTGYSQMDQEVARQLGISLGDAGLSRDKSTADLTKQGGDLETGYTREQSGYGNQRANLKTDHDKTRLQSTEDIQRAKERVSTLENTAKDFGLQKDDLRIQLEKGINNLNYQGRMSVDQLMDLQSQDNVAGTQLLLQLLNAAKTGADNGQYKASGTPTVGGRPMFENPSRPGPWAP